MALLTWTKRALVALLLIVIVLAASIYFLLRGSLPVLDGAQSLQGLSQAVQVSRDGNGTVTITAANDADSARALGYVHAQERYFEMDLLRRSAAGELSALFGEIAVEKDKSIRIHRLRARIREHFAQMAGTDAAVLQAYADGVNAGLADLSV
ncbi:MAG: penicillin acylase family protein, partial [Arenimonas sp.]